MTAAITINFRKAELTISCVHSLVADGWSPILVWDNSEDNGDSWRDLQASLADMPDVHLIQSPVNLGFAAGMNRALEWIRARVAAGPVLLINNDAVALPGLHAALQAASDAASCPALVAPQVQQSGKVQGWMYYQPWFGLVLDRPVWGAVPYLSGCCLLVNRPYVDGPLFDESFFMYGEDVELSRRVVAEGGRLCLVPQIYVNHVGSAASGQATPFYERHMVRAHWALASKLAHSFVAKSISKALRLPVLTARALLRSVRYRNMSPIRALAEILSR